MASKKNWEFDNKRISTSGDTGPQMPSGGPEEPSDLVGFSTPWGKRYFRRSELEQEKIYRKVSNNNLRSAFSRDDHGSWVWLLTINNIATTLLETNYDGSAVVQECQWQLETNASTIITEFR